MKVRTPFKLLTALLLLALLLVSLVSCPSTPAPEPKKPEPTIPATPEVPAKKPPKEFKPEDWGDAWQQVVPGVWNPIAIGTGLPGLETKPSLPSGNTPKNPSQGGNPLKPSDTNESGNDKSGNTGTIAGNSNNGNTNTGTEEAQVDFILSEEVVVVGTRGSDTAQDAYVQILGGSGDFSVVSSDPSRAQAEIVSFDNVHVVSIRGLGVYEATITVKDKRARRDGSFAQKTIAVRIEPRSYGSFDSVTKIRNLPDEISASSGLIYSDSSFYTIIDSSNQRFFPNAKRYSAKPILYKLDGQTGKITQRITISGVSNTDWEDLAADKDYIYIADTGYKKLNGDTPDDYSIGSSANKVYRISKQAIRDAGADAEVSVAVDKVINLNINGRPDYRSSTKDGDTDWDFEALSVKEDSLILFSKQWKNNSKAQSFSHTDTLNEALDSSSSTLAVQKDKAFALKSGYMVTGAEYDQANDVMFLVGYIAETLHYEFNVASPIPVPQRAYLSVITSYSKNPKVATYDLGAELTTSQSKLKSGQWKPVDKTIGYEVEGICVTDDGEVYITNETTDREDGKLGVYYKSYVPATLHRINFR